MRSRANEVRKSIAADNAAELGNIVNGFNISAGTGRFKTYYGTNTYSYYYEQEGYTFYVNTADTTYVVIDGTYYEAVWGNNDSRGYYDNDGNLIILWDNSYTYTDDYGNTIYVDFNYYCYLVLNDNNYQIYDDGDGWYVYIDDVQYYIDHYISIDSSSSSDEDDTTDEETEE